jgi:1-acyl-sn-glycerol-3-phosphate acyltransferase
VPAPWVRRPITISIWLIVSSAGLLASPLLLVAGRLATAITRRPQPLIVARLLVTYFARELTTLVAAGALWAASGAGARIRTDRFTELHWRLVRWFIHGITARALSMCDIRIAPEPAPEAARALKQDGPLILFSRHAGPGDTLLVLDQLLCRYDRRPSVVLKQAIALDPAVDLLAHRLPHAVLDPADSEDARSQIESIAAGLGPRGVLLLFPEGANFTRERRREALARLRRRGRRRALERAQRMSHVLPPRPSGALAALRGSRGADVVFAAHTGLGLAAYPRELWREMPIGETLRTRMWLVPGRELPAQADDQVTWLNEWWERIDRWIEEQRTEP